MRNSAFPNLAVSAPSVGSGRFVFLDALRGLGALGVACYHIHRYHPLREPVDSLLPQFLQTALLYGWIGVPVFFLIAGFVTAHSLRNTSLSLVGFGNYALRRVVRLGFPYWATILFVVALDALLRYGLHAASLVSPLRGPRVWVNLLFLQDILGYRNVSAGTWFVCIDLQFGLLFALLWAIAQRAARDWVRSLLLMLLFLPLGLLSLYWFVTLRTQYDMWVLYFFCMPLFGALAYWALERRIPRIVFWAFAVIMAASVGYGWRLEIVIALIAGLVIYGVGRAGHLTDWLAGRRLQYLGRISYSLFLIHYPVGWLVVSLGHWLTDGNPSLAIGWLLIAMAASLLAADLMYRFVELPSVRLATWLKTRHPRPQPSVDPALTSFPSEIS
ncbi:MAG: acyltransferase [Planctomycetaceae bacterium]|nr:acyltransferase [Planctomycetaceae bacterium]